MAEFCTVSESDGIWVVTINRPERMNAVHPPTNFELEAIFDRYEADDSARVAILTGAGDKAFCAGFRSIVFSTLPAPLSGRGSVRRLTDVGHL